MRKYQSPRQLARQSNILACARQMLEESGYSGVTMRALAKRAGVALATLYNLYGSKDDLLVAAVDDLLTELAVRANASDAVPGIDGLIALAKVTGAQIQATPNYAEAVARALFKVQKDDPLVEVLFARGYPYMLEHLTIAQQNGHVRPEVNVSLVAKHLIANSWGQVISWMMGMQPLSATVDERHRSELMTLIAVTRGTTRKRLENQLLELGWEEGADAEPGDRRQTNSR